MENKLKFYDDLLAQTEVFLSIGGSIALYMQNDPSINKGTYQPGDIDLSVATEEDLAICREYLLSQGYYMSLDFKAPFMFGVRQQFKNAVGDKHDFFINPGIKTWSSVLEDGRVYTNTALVWAARSYYAGKNHAKAFDQMVAAGMVTSATNTELTVRKAVKSFNGKVLKAKRVLFAVLLWVVARRSPALYKVGAIYRQGWRISWGYNLSSTYGQHAEDMAIARFERWYKRPAKGGVCWCTYSACTHCTTTLKTRAIVSCYVHKYRGQL